MDLISCDRIKLVKYRTIMSGKGQMRRHEPAVKGMDIRNKKVEFMFRLEKKFNTFSNPYFLI